MPSPFSLRRFKRLRRPTATELAAAAVGTCVDAFVFLTANWSMTEDSLFRWIKSR